MTRIIGGEAKGRRLVVPAGRTTRPTSDRAREALFSSLLSALGDLDGLRVLDLYAGSGAVGLEALSRGAAHVQLVESDRSTSLLIEENVKLVGLPGASVRTADVDMVVDQQAAGAPYDVVFLDPPYVVPGADVHRVLERLVANGWLAEDAVVVVERPTRRGEFGWPEGLVGERERKYGEGTLWYGRASEA